MVRWPSLLWIPAELFLVLFAHGSRVEYLPIEALTATVWAALLGLGAILASRLARSGHITPVALVLTVASAVFIAPMARALFGRRQASPELGPGRAYS
ncbi:hypothetical protein C7C45_17320 [Micromonospora arborensis]|uniref:Uncharacterized protein n=2 Tax=Micromonospora arborensis TaxID=2116518 RepID=A0A318NKV3_9ACTN|nr:hypothetical protein C7C45_17320 [Micromonospora arborensis]